MTRWSPTRRRDGEGQGEGEQAEVPTSAAVSSACGGAVEAERRGPSAGLHARCRSAGSRPPPGPPLDRRLRGPDRVRQLGGSAYADNACSRRRGRPMSGLLPGDGTRAWVCSETARRYCERRRSTLRSEHQGIPDSVRREVYLRDGTCCRMCGKFLGERAGIHHIDFGGGLGPGMGGGRVHDPEKMVVLCWLPGDPAWKSMTCHARAHSDKLLWQPLLTTVVTMPGVTAFQLRRWATRPAPGGAERSPASSNG